ncbi:MAG: tetratricopeptide repeat protein [Planctomycetota bacterium]|jgi:TolA-binding protein
MSQDKLTDLLQNADQIAPRPSYKIKSSSVSLHRLAQQKHRRIWTASIAACLLVAVSITLTIAYSHKTRTEQQKIIALETRIKQIQADADATLNLVRQVISQQQQQQKLDELNAQLAAIPDPIEEMNQQIERTAFILLYQADRYGELNLKQSAIDSYNRLIELFPQTDSAQKAKQKLENIELNSINEKQI